MTLKCKNPYFDENIDRKFVFLLYSVLVEKKINLVDKFAGLFLSNNKIGVLETDLDFEMCTFKEASVYETFAGCIPDGMNYNKELDKLVPDVASVADECFSGIKIKFEKVVDYVDQKENISCKNEKSKHYELWKDFEAIDVLKNCLTKDEFIGFLKGNILKYQLRLGKKDDVSKEMIKIKDYQNELNHLLKELNVK